MRRWPALRFAGGLLATTLLLAVVVWVVGALLQRGATVGPTRAGEPAERPEALRGDEPAVPAQISLVVESADPPARGYSQSPLLDDLVDDGTLPPVAQRLPERPLVLRGVDGTGRWGGTWRRLASSVTDVEAIKNRLSYASPLRWSPGGDPIVPHVVERVDVADDAQRYTLHLRRGLRWSDGEPCDADDILYWWNHEVLDPDLGGAQPPFWMMVGAEVPQVTKLDAATVEVLFPSPNGLFLEQLATNGADMLDSPQHYLGQFHPRLGDPQTIARYRDAYGMPSPTALYAYMQDWQNPEHPRLWPWVYREYSANPPFVFVRNPYYLAVDEEGRQLPYFDRLQFDVVRQELMPQALGTGGATVQTRHAQFADITEYLTRAQSGQIELKFWSPASFQSWVLSPNLNKRVTPDDPQSRGKAELLGNKAFRQALSLAIDRPRIIEAEYKNVGKPSQVAPGAGSDYANPDFAVRYTQHDPARANALLDGLGLRRGPDGMRRLPDGSPLLFFINYTSFTGRGPADFVLADWREVGIQALARQRARSLYNLQIGGGTGDFFVWAAESDYNPLINPRYFVPWNQSSWAYRWGQWNLQGGPDTPDSSKTPLALAPPPGPVREAIDLFRRAQREPTLEGRIALFRQLHDIVSEEVWSIGISVSPPQAMIVEPGVGNVPDNAVFGWSYKTPGNAGMETYFYADGGADSPGAVAQARQSLRQPTPRPTFRSLAAAGDADRADTDGGGGGGGDGGGGWLGYLFATAGALSVVLVGLRHPYIGRRLLIMIPTLLVMSVLIFVIIQTPPGDYLQARITELQEQGDPNAQRQIEDLRQQFRFDDPAWRQYLRWVGLQWFITWEASDTGLLQGDLGRSMSTGQPVNQMVGDRLLLTVAISAGTILFTWLLAVPIGVYSAVRQYALSDYLFTTVGFIGLAIPNFLFALVLSTLAGVSGLFSPQYATQPEWDLAKLGDLMLHIWVPVVVIGTSGTAGMIRVMRANMLDELKKPYVVTARAKGVRPIRLLFKYPFRLAINPFISGIGGILPRLVSGGAIVAIVLSLPTVGPLMLDSLLIEDMYLAGSLLLVLSLLGIIGTLVSDLLLVLIDPRIRLTGGRK